MRPSVYASWAAFWAFNPWGEERADRRSAIVAHTVATAMMKKQGGAPWRIDEFMPYAQRDEQEAQRSLSQRIRSVFNFIGKSKAKT